MGSALGTMVTKNSRPGFHRKTAVFYPEVLRRFVEERRRLHIRAALGVVFLVSAVGVTIWATDGKILSDFSHVLRNLDGQDAQASRNHAQNCQDSRNKHTPYCQEKKAETEQNWSAMTRYKPSAPNQFTLHREGR